jgi:hypothetical protein
MVIQTKRTWSGSSQTVDRTIELDNFANPLFIATGLPRAPALLAVCYGDGGHDR